MAERWEITSRMVIYYCERDLIPGAVKKGTVRLIPTVSDKLEDRRRKSISNKTKE